jgi:hypothetical protein
VAVATETYHAVWVAVATEAYHAVWVAVATETYHAVWVAVVTEAHHAVWVAVATETYHAAVCESLLLQRIQKIIGWFLLNLVQMSHHWKWQHVYVFTAALINSEVATKRNFEIGET